MRNKQYQQDKSQLDDTTKKGVTHENNTSHATPKGRSILTRELKYVRRIGLCHWFRNKPSIKERFEQTLAKRLESGNISFKQS